MQKFYIEYTEKHTALFIVEAENADEAKERFDQWQQSQDDSFVCVFDAAEDFSSESRVIPEYDERIPSWWYGAEDEFTLTDEDYNNMF